MIYSSKFLSKKNRSYNLIIFVSREVLSISYFKLKDTKNLLKLIYLSNLYLIQIFLLNFSLSV